MAIDGLELLDAQVHVWEHDHPARPWSTAPPPQVAEPAPFFAGTSVVTEVFPRIMKVIPGIGDASAGM